MKFRLVTDGNLPGALNMARDEAILMNVRNDSIPTFRFYGWDPPCLSIGYFQDLFKEVDFEALALEGVDLVRRITGGKAVLHDAELTYSLAIPEKMMPGSIMETYLEISKGLVKGLNLLGIEAEMGALEKGVTGRDARFQNAACFAAPSWYEILFKGKKLVGSAQARKDGVILQHGSIPLLFNGDKVVKCLKTKSSEHQRRLAGLLQKKASGVFQIIGSSVDLDNIREAIIKGFELALGWEFYPGVLTEEEERHSKILNREKYSVEKWNFERGKLSEDIFQMGGQ